MLGRQTQICELGSDTSGIQRRSLPSAINCSTCKWPAKSCARRICFGAGRPPFDCNQATVISPGRSRLSYVKKFSIAAKSCMAWNGS